MYLEGNGTGIMQVENDSRNNTSSVQPWYESRSFYPDPSVAGDNQVFKAGVNYGPSGHVDRYQNAWGFAYENNYTTGSLPGITGHGVYEFHGPEVIYTDTVKNDAGTKFATGVTDQTARRMITFEASNERPSLGGAGTFMVDRMNYYDFKTATQRVIHNVGYISGAAKGWHFLDTASIYLYKNDLGGLFQYNAANSGFIGLIKADASDRVTLGHANTVTLHTPTTNFEMPNGMNFKVTGGAGFEFGTTSSYAGSVIFNTADIFNRSSSNPTGFNTVIAPNYNIADVSTGTTIFSLPNDASNPVMIANNTGGGRMGIFKSPDGDKVLQVGNSGLSSTSKMFHIENSTGGSTFYRYDAAPESAISANPGDIAIINESGTGSVYLKGSGTGNTGWLNMLTANAQQQFRVSRTLQAAGGVVYIGIVKEQNAGAAMIQVDIVVGNGGGSALAKKYFIPKQFATTGSAWKKCLPISDRGPYGSDDFTLEIRNSGTDGTSDSLRIRTEAGSTVLGTAEVTLTFSPWIPGQMSFTPLSITSTPATVSSIYVGTPLNVVNGKVGVNKHGPAEALDITGNLRFSGALMPNNAAGSSGQVLTSAGAGSPPTWAAAATGDITNGGNTTGAAITIGTNDNNALNFETNNVTRVSIASGASTGGQITDTNVTANTATVQDAVTIRTNSSGTAAAGFGGGILFQGESSTTDNRDMARISAPWTTATDASREASLLFQIGNNGGALSTMMKLDAVSNTSGVLEIGASSPFTITNANMFPSQAYSITGGGFDLTMSTTALLYLSNTVNNPTSTNGIKIGTGTAFTQTSGTRNYLDYNYSFAPTSGTAVHNQLNISSTFNQTGGANGITRSINIAPTLTAVADYRALEISANSANAKGIYQTGASTTNNIVGKTTHGATTAPTALLMLAAGTATANTAPLKFTSGTNLTAVENGAVEYDGTDYFVSSGGTRYLLTRTLRGSATLDFPSTSAGTVSDLTITVTGAADGDVVSFSVPNASQTADGRYSAWVSAADTVTIRFSPISTADPASGTFKATVQK